MFDTSWKITHGALKMMLCNCGTFEQETFHCCGYFEAALPNTLDSSTVASLLPIRGTTFDQGS